MRKFALLRGTSFFREIRDASVLVLANRRLSHRGLRDDVCATASPKKTSRSCANASREPVGEVWAVFLVAGSVLVAVGFLRTVYSLLGGGLYGFVMGTRFGRTFGDNGGYDVVLLGRTLPGARLDSAEEGGNASRGSNAGWRKADSRSSFSFASVRSATTS